jgi:hypothetical protein
LLLIELCVYYLSFVTLGNDFKSQILQPLLNKDSVVISEDKEDKIKYVFPPNLIAQKSCYGRTLVFEV